MSKESLDKTLTLPSVVQPGDVFGQGAHAGAVDDISDAGHAPGTSDISRTAVDDGGGVQEAGSVDACAAALGVISVPAGLVHLLVHATGEHERGQWVEVCKDHNCVHHLRQRPAVVPFRQFLNTNS